MFRQMPKMILAALLLGATSLPAGAEKSGDPADSSKTGIRLSEWGAESIPFELDGSAGMQAPDESGAPGLGEFLAEEARTFAAGATDFDRLRGMMASRAIGQEDDSALMWISSRWESAPGRFADFFAGQAEARLESLPWVQSADIRWTPDNGDWATFSASGVGVLHRGGDSVFGILPDIARNESDGRARGAFGVFHRRAFGDWGVGGVNIFADYANDRDDGEFARWSMGADFQSPWADVFVNRYFGRDAAREFIVGTRREAVYAPDGLDAEFRLRAPNQNWISGFARFSKWEGRFGRKDDSEAAYGMTFAPTRGGLAGLRAEMSAGDSAKFELQFERILGVENILANAAPFAVEQALTAPAQRARDIVLRRVEIEAASAKTPASPDARQFINDDAVPSYLRDVYEECQWAGEFTDWLSNDQPPALRAITDYGWAVSVAAAASSDQNFDNLCQALRHQGNPNHASGGNNNTPLHKAAAGAALKNVKLLLLAGADPTRLNSDNKSPLDAAADKFNELIGRVDFLYCHSISAIAPATGQLRRHPRADKLCEIGRILRANGAQCERAFGRPLCHINNGGYPPLNHHNSATPGRHVPHGRILTVTMHSELQSFSPDDSYLNADSPFYSAINTPAIALLNLVDAQTSGQKIGIDLVELFGNQGAVRIKYIGFNKPPLISVHQDGFVVPYTYREQERNHGARTPIAGMGAVTLAGALRFSAVSNLSLPTFNFPAFIVVTVVDPGFHPVAVPEVVDGFAGELFRAPARMRAGNAQFSLRQAGRNFALSVVSAREAAVRIPAGLAAGEYAATLRAKFFRDGTALNTAELAFTATVKASVAMEVTMGMTMGVSLVDADRDWAARPIRYAAPGYSGVLFSVTVHTPVPRVDFAALASDWRVAAVPVPIRRAAIRAESPLTAGNQYVGQVRATLTRGDSVLELANDFTVIALEPIPPIYATVGLDFRGSVAMLSIDSRLRRLSFHYNSPSSQLTVNSAGQIGVRFTLDLHEKNETIVAVTSPDMLGTLYATVHVVSQCLLPPNLDSLRPLENSNEDRAFGSRLIFGLGRSFTLPDLCRLLREGADPNHSNGLPLRTSARYNLMEHIKLLIKFGASVHREDPRLHENAMHHAAYYGSYETARLLYAHGISVNRSNAFGWNELHMVSNSRPSIDYDRVRMIDFLVSVGVDVNAQNNNNDTPLKLAVGNRNLRLVDALLRNGADPNIPGESTCETPLHNARDLHIVIALVGAGAHVNARATGSSRHGRTPLDSFGTYAIYSEIQDVLKARGGCYGTTEDGLPQCSNNFYPGTPARTRFRCPNTGTELPYSVAYPSQ